MRTVSWTICGLLAVALWVGLTLGGATSTRAQTTINPDISLIGDLRAFWHDDTARGDAEALNLELHEAELALQGYLNPYARADVFFAWHGESRAEIEELYITFLRGLPLGMTARAGRYLLDFGKINPLHPHVYSFIKRPLAHEEFFGHEGLRDVGISVSIAVPTGAVASDLSADLLDGSFLTPHEHGTHDDGHDHRHIGAGARDEDPDAEPRPNKPAFAARWNSFFALADFSSLSLGATVLTGVPHEDQRHTIGGADVKFKWKPDRYRSFTAVAEGIVNRQPVAENHHPHAAVAVPGMPMPGGGGDDGDAGGDCTSHGLFGYIDYQFRQRYNVGALGDWVRSTADSDRSSWRLGVFAGFAPVEETSLLRLLVARTEPPESDGAVWEGTVQLVFSLGPHRPHDF